MRSITPNRQNNLESTEKKVFIILSNTLVSEAGVQIKQLKGISGTVQCIWAWRTQMEEGLGLASGWVRGGSES